MHKYGLPKDMTDKEIQEMRKKHNEIFERFEALLNDSEFQEEVRQFVKISSHLSEEKLNRKFTI